MSVLAGSPRRLATAARSGGRGARAILIAGLLAGVLDISAAFVQAGVRGAAPGRVLQGIASGALGPAAFSGGGGTAALGLFLHFVIACGAATVFYLASRGLPLLTRRPVLSGMLYGVLVYGVMNLLVVPLSRVQTGARSWSSVAILVGIHILCVGLPISLTMARMAGGSRRAVPAATLP